MCGGSGIGGGRDRECVEGVVLVGGWDRECVEEVK